MLTKPLLRVGERGNLEFKEIEWEEALPIAAAWLGHIPESDPKKLAFFTGRDRSLVLVERRLVFAEAKHTVTLSSRARAV
jgi:anaerobic selenocysteine-containing dehydrogenase